MEDELYDVESTRCFASLTLVDSTPDETTILNFRHFLEEHKLGKAMFNEVSKHPERRGDAALRQHRGCQHHLCTQLDQGQRDLEIH